MTSPCAAKRGANSARKTRGTGEKGAMSDNGNYAPFAWTDPAIVARFSAKVDRDGPVHPTLGQCWFWTGSRTGHPRKNHPAHSLYGQFTYRHGGPQRHIYAHRFAWALTHGAVPSVHVLHHCDNPPCVNPDHLYLGTQADNMRDAASRHRFHVPRTRRLSLLDRLTIARTPWYRGVVVALAREYGVTKAAISRIRRGRFIGAAQAVELIA